MLFRELFIEELKKRRDEFARYAEDSSAARDHYAELLQKLAVSDGAEIRARFAGEKNIGALPSAELDNLKTLTVDFGTEWSSHEKS
jgi:hypothetical protein